MLEAGYDKEHDLYPVNPKVDEIRGLKCYPSILDCPDPVDHIICQIPAPGVPELVDQAIEKGVKSIHFFTAGFSETGDEDLTVIENKFVAKGRAAGIRMIGPNCMGLYVPGVGLAFMGGFSTEPGNTFLLSQSGANAGDIIGTLSGRGVRFSKAVSYGNGADLRAHDFLDYAAADPQTEVVTAYIEGVRDGRAFFDALRRCAAIKPTILLKGGVTDAGARAANSHTGSLAGSVDVFEALARQTGAIRATKISELSDLVIASTTALRDVRGRGVVLIAGGGGFSVLSSDQLAMQGLEVPPMSDEVVDELREFIPVAGTSVRNPIDANLGRHSGDGDTTKRLYRLVAGSPGIDMVFTTVGGWGGWAGAPEGPGRDSTLEEQIAHAEDSARSLAELQIEVGVPIVAIRRERGDVPLKVARAFDQTAYNHGVAVYSSLEEAASAVSRLFEWRAQRDGLPELFAPHA